MGLIASFAAHNLRRGLGRSWRSDRPSAQNPAHAPCQGWCAAPPPIPTPPEPKVLKDARGCVQSVGSGCGLGYHSKCAIRRLHTLRSLPNVGLTTAQALEIVVVATLGWPQALPNEAMSSVATFAVRTQSRARSQSVQVRFISISSLRGVAHAQATWHVTTIVPALAMLRTRRRSALLNDPRSASRPNRLPASQGSVLPRPGSHGNKRLPKPCLRAAAPNRFASSASHTNSFSSRPWLPGASAFRACCRRGASRNRPSPPATQPEARPTLR